MIDSSKLLSRVSANRNLVSRKVLVDLTIVKRDAVKIDNLLKERLVLTKVREGIERQQKENEMRREREQQLEEKRDDESANVDPNKKKQPKSLLGNIIKFVLTGFLKVIGRLTLGILPRLPFLLKTIVRFTRFFGTIIRGTFNVARTLIKVAPKFISNFGKFTGKIITQIIGVITKSIVPAATGFVGRIAGLLSAPFAGAGARRLTGGAAKTVEAKAVAKTTVAPDIAPKVRPGTQLTLFEELERQKLAQQPLQMAETDVLQQRKIIQKKYAPKQKITAETIIGSDGVKYRQGLITDKIQFKVKPGEIEATEKLIKSFGLEDIDAQNLRLNKNIPDVMNQLDLIEREALENVDLRKQIERETGTRIRDFKPEGSPLKRAIVGDQPLMKAPKLPKVKASKLVGKKGLSKILFNVGGEALEQSVKQSIKASIGVIPILGDLIGVLLDVFLFGEPVGRAVFKGIGSLALGALLGGVGTFLGGPIGTLIGSIIGGIGGDILGGIAYDLFFGRKPQAGGYSTVTGGSKEYLKGVSKARAVQNFNEGGVVREYEPPKQVISDRSSNLQSLAFYEKTQVGREVMIPIPIPINNNKNQGGGENIVIHSRNVQKRNSFSQLYRRG
jgi:hypothetical protein